MHPRAPRRPAGTRLLMERLDDRALPSATATFNTSVLTVTGTEKDEAITVGADAAGNLTVVVDESIVTIDVTFGSANLANLKTVNVDARGGNDRITLDPSLNTVGIAGLIYAPDAVLVGGSGDDFIDPNIGGFLNGIPGNPIVGNVTQRGGDGKDFLDSGFGNDLMYGEGGDDILQWLPGTLIDHYDGGDGFDAGVVAGNDGNQADAFVLSKDPSRPGGVLFQRTNLVPFFITMVNIDGVTLVPQSGNDTITINDLSGTPIQVVIADTGSGDDTVDGKNTNAPVWGIGGDGNDVMYGGKGNDALFGGAGDDRLTDAVGGNDQFFGEAGNDFVFSDVGLDLLDGGAGNDVLRDYDAQDDAYFGGDGNDELIAGAGNDTLDGGAGDDYLFGGDGNDTMYGRDGNDRMYGVGGADYLDGGNGNDSLDGNNGPFSTPDGAIDKLRGGPGADTFVLYRFDVLDVIEDYNPAEGDTLWVF